MEYFTQHLLSKADFLCPITFAQEVFPLLPFFVVHVISKGAALSHFSNTTMIQEDKNT